MADATAVSSTPQPRKRRHWLRVIAWLIGVLIVLVIVLYFVVTSSAFLKSEILPRVSSSLNASVTVGSADIHPFSEIVLHDLKVQPTNQPPLVTAPEVRVKYSLLDIIGGNIHVDEIALISPSVEIVQNPDGTSNLDPLLNAQKKAAGQKSAEQKPKQPAKPSKPAQIDIGKLTLTGASFRRVQNHIGGTSDLAELTNVNLTLANVKNGGSGKVDFNALIRDENNPPAPAMYGLLLATAKGTFDFTLTPDLKPAMVVGDAQLNISQAAGSFSDFGKLVGAFHCDVSPTEIKGVSLGFEREGVRLGELRASGPFDAQKSEGRLSVELLSVDKRVLNLFAARSGFDFGSTTITCTNEIDLAKSGSLITVAGQLSANKFQLARTNESTPPLDLRADYNVSIDNTEKNALLQTLNLTGTQDGRPLLRGELTSPMTLAWGNTTNAVGDSSFNLAVTKLNITDWKTFLGNVASAGTLDFDLKLLSHEGGKQLTFNVTNRIQNLTAQVGSQHITDAALLLKVNGQGTDFNRFNLTEYSLQLDQANQTALRISGSGTYDQANASADLELGIQGTLARLLHLLNQPDVSASSGTVDLQAHVIQKQQTQTVTGKLTLAKFSGKYGKNEFKDFGVTADLDVAKTPEQIDLHKVAGKLTEGGKAGGEFDLSGTYGMENKPTQLNVKLADFNQYGLRSFLEPLLANKKLVSVSINGTASAQLTPNGNSAVKAVVQVTDLVVRDPAQKSPPAPLEAKLQVDASLVKKIADVRQLQIALTPTQRAKNELNFHGQVDMSKSNAITGHLTLAADSLDLTSYYDVFTSTNNSTAKEAGRNKPQNTAATATSQAAQPPQTNALPVKNFTVDASVRAFYLREIAATNFQTTVKLDGSHVLLKPFQLTLNGAPMFATADVDMSVPGYKYVLTYNTTNVPFAPLWNTFKPEEKGKVGGTLTAYMYISGTGTSGEILQKTLTGNFHVGTTNLNLSVSTIDNKMLRGLVNVVAIIPDIAQNPASIVNFAGGMVSGKLSGSLSEDLKKSPIDVITTDGVATNGQVILKNTVVRNPTFEATVAKGTIKLAPVLTNSAIDIPVSIALNNAIIQRFPSLGGTSASTNNQGYTKLPDFFSEQGTIGDPKMHISPTAFAKGVIKNYVPGLGGTNGILSNPLHSLGGFLHGESNTNQSATNNPPATNSQSPVNNLLNRFLGK